MSRAAGVRCVMLAEDDVLVEYAAWKCDVGLLVKQLRAVGGIGDGTPYLLDILDEDRDIIDDHPLTNAGVEYLREGEFLTRLRTPTPAESDR